MKDYYDEVTSKRKAFKEAQNNGEPAAKKIKQSNLVTMDFILKR